MSEKFNKVSDEKIQELIDNYKKEYILSLLGLDEENELIDNHAEDYRREERLDFGELFEMADFNDNTSGMSHLEVIDHVDSSFDTGEDYYYEDGDTYYSMDSNIDYYRNNISDLEDFFSWAYDSGYVADVMVLEDFLEWCVENDYLELEKEEVVNDDYVYFLVIKGLFNPIISCKHNFAMYYGDYLYELYNHVQYISIKGDEKYIDEVIDLVIGAFNLTGDTDAIAKRDCNQIYFVKKNND